MKGGSCATARQPRDSMHTDCTTDTNGQLRQKRGDTLFGNIEKEYDLDFGPQRHA